MSRFASVAVLVLALTGSLFASAGAASAEPSPTESAVALITGAGHCC